MVRPKIPYLPAVEVYQQVNDYMYAFTFPGTNKDGDDVFHTAVDTFVQYPGCHYAPEYGRGKWVCPVEGLRWLEHAAANLGLGFRGYSTSISTRKLVTAHSSNKLHKYQTDFAVNAVTQNARMAAFDMGLGKTAAAIEAFRLSGKQTALIACPKAAIYTWAQEFKKWYPEVDVHIVHKTADVGKYPIEVVSYNRLVRSGALLTRDCLIFDESHYLKNNSTQTFKFAEAVRNQNPKALTLALTGTPIADSPKDLQAQLHILYPGRFGTPYRFSMRYTERSPNPFATSGYIFKGLNEEYASELRDRLALVCDRVTKSDVAHLLPPITMQPIYVDAPAHDVATTPITFNEMQTSLSTFVSITAAKWVQDAMDSGIDRILVFTRLRKTAAEIHDTLDANGVIVRKITGEELLHKRLQRIEIAQRHAKHVIVATMASVGIGINELANYNTVLCAELDFYPTTVSQALARTNRLSSRLPTSAYALIPRGTINEIIVRTIQKKLKDSCKLLKGGAVDKAIASMQKHESRKAWQTRMLKAFSDAALDDCDE